jgi:hypothetical protein
MLISNKFLFAFGEVPKCGTTSIRESLLPYSYHFMGEKYGRHISFREAQEEGLNLGNYFCFFLIRNPWEMLVSKYTYHRQTKTNVMYGTIDANRKAKQLPFREWIKEEPLSYLAYNTVKRKLISAQEKTYLINYHDMVADNDGTILVDRIYNFNRLDLFYRHIEGMARIKLKRYHLNKSPHGDYRIYYDDTAIECVGRYYKWSIDTFGFIFDDIYSGVPLVKFSELLLVGEEEEKL